LKDRTVVVLKRWAFLAPLGFTLALALPGGEAYGADWPQWRGPNRDGKSTETGLLKAWPDGGPRLIWTSRDIGYGYSTVTIKDGIIYTTGIVGEDLVIFALDLDGTLKWKVTHGRGWAHRRKHPGSRAIPTIDGDRFYLISGYGQLGAFERKTGKRIWMVDLIATFRGKVPMWGGAESVLIDGNNLICTPGGREVGLVALDKITGKTVWKSKPVGTSASYASPILFEFGGVRQIANLVQSGLVCVEADTGRFLWRYDRAASRRRPSVSDPIFANGAVFGASGYNNGGGLVKLTVTGDRVTATEAWDTKKMVNHHGAMILLDGYIYGNHQKGWSCLDLKTGKQMYYADGVGKGSITYADGMFYCFSERTGTVGLVKATPSVYDLVSTFKVPSGGSGPYWAHPVVCGGRLYLRYANRLFAYDIRAPEYTTRPTVPTGRDANTGKE